jgi:hypothetical protein
MIKYVYKHKHKILVSFSVLPSFLCMVVVRRLWRVCATKMQFHYYSTSLF